MPRPLTPTAILKAKGALSHDPGRYKGRKNEPVPKGPLGDPPKDLDRDEKAAWKELSSIIPDGVAYNSDRWAMKELVRLMVKADRKVISVSERGLLQSYFAKFGLTPSDRPKVQAKPPEVKDEWDELDGPITTQ